MVAKDLVKVFKDEVEEKKVKFVQQVLLQDQNRKGDSYIFNRQAVQVILYHILWNSIQNTEKDDEQKKIKILMKTERSEKGKAWLSLKVLDQGMGIDDKMVGLLNLENCMSEEYCSNVEGMGLSFVKRIVESLGGTFKIKDIRRSFEEEIRMYSTLAVVKIPMFVTMGQVGKFFKRLVEKRKAKEMEKNLVSSQFGSLFKNGVNIEDAI